MGFVDEDLVKRQKTLSRFIQAYNAGETDPYLSSFG